MNVPRFEELSKPVQIPLTANVGLIAALVLATAGFIAAFVYYL